MASSSTSSATGPRLHPLPQSFVLKPALKRPASRTGEEEDAPPHEDDIQSFPPAAAAGSSKPKKAVSWCNMFSSVADPDAKGEANIAAGSFAHRRQQHLLFPAIRRSSTSSAGRQRADGVQEQREDDDVQTGYYREVFRGLKEHVDRVCEERAAEESEASRSLSKETLAQQRNDRSLVNAAERRSEDVVAGILFQQHGMTGEGERLSFKTLLLGVKGRNVVRYAIEAMLAKSLHTKIQILRRGRREALLPSVKTGQGFGKQEEEGEQRRLHDRVLAQRRVAGAGTVKGETYKDWEKRVNETRGWAATSTALFHSASASAAVKAKATVRRTLPRPTRIACSPSACSMWVNGVELRSYPTLQLHLHNADVDWMRGLRYEAEPGSQYKWRTHLEEDALLLCKRAVASFLRKHGGGAPGVDAGKAGVREGSPGDMRYGNGKKKKRLKFTGHLNRLNLMRPVYSCVEVTRVHQSTNADPARRQVRDNAEVALTVFFDEFHPAVGSILLDCFARGTTLLRGSYRVKAAKWRTDYAEYEGSGGEVERVKRRLVVKKEQADEAAMEDRRGKSCADGTKTSSSAGPPASKEETQGQLQTGELKAAEKEVHQLKQLTSHILRNGYDSLVLEVPRPLRFLAGRFFADHISSGLFLQEQHARRPHEPGTPLERCRSPFEEGGTGSGSAEEDAISASKTTSEVQTAQNKTKERKKQTCMRTQEPEGFVRLKMDRLRVFDGFPNTHSVAATMARAGRLRTDESKVDNLNTKGSSSSAGAGAGVGGARNASAATFATTEDFLDPNFPSGGQYVVLSFSYAQDLAHAVLAARGRNKLLRVPAILVSPGAFKKRGFMEDGKKEVMTFSPAGSATTTSRRRVPEVAPELLFQFRVSLANGNRFAAKMKNLKAEPFVSLRRVEPSTSVREKLFRQIFAAEFSGQKEIPANTNEETAFVERQRRLWSAAKAAFEIRVADEDPVDTQQRRLQIRRAEEFSRRDGEKRHFRKECSNVSRQGFVLLTEKFNYVDLLLDLEDQKSKRSCDNPMTKRTVGKPLPQARLPNYMGSGFTSATNYIPALSSCTSSGSAVVSLSSSSSSKPAPAAASATATAVASNIGRTASSSASTTAGPARQHPSTQPGKEKVVPTTSSVPRPARPTAFRCPTADSFYVLLDPDKQTMWRNFVRVRKRVALEDGDLIDLLHPHQVPKDVPFPVFSFRFRVEYNRRSPLLNRIIDHKPLYATGMWDVLEDLTCIGEKSPQTPAEDPLLFDSKKIMTTVFLQYLKRYGSPPPPLPRCMPDEKVWSAKGFKRSVSTERQVPRIEEAAAAAAGQQKNNSSLVLDSLADLNADPAEPAATWSVTRAPATIKTGPRLNEGARGHETGGTTSTWSASLFQPSIGLGLARRPPVVGASNAAMASGSARRSTTSSPPLVDLNADPDEALDDSNVVEQDMDVESNVVEQDMDVEQDETGIAAPQSFQEQVWTAKSARSAAGKHICSTTGTAGASSAPHNGNSKPISSAHGGGRGGATITSAAWSAGVAARAGLISTATSARGATKGTGAALLGAAPCSSAASSRPRLVPPPPTPAATWCARSSPHPPKPAPPPPPQMQATWSARQASSVVNEKKRRFGDVD